MEQDLEARAIEAAKGMYWASYDEYGHDRAFADGIAAYQRVMREAERGRSETTLDELLNELVGAAIHLSTDGDVQPHLADIHAHVADLIQEARNGK